MENLDHYLYTDLLYRLRMDYIGLRAGKYTNRGNYRGFVALHNAHLSWFTARYQGRGRIMLTKKEKKLVIKWFKVALDDILKDEPLTIRQSLHGQCGRGPAKVAFVVTTSVEHLAKIDGVLPSASKTACDWLAKEEVE